MCTVTFLPLKNNDFILTSNRDEQKERETLPPLKYEEDGVEMTFPKDKIAGGTWIGTSSKNRLVCLLNGAFEKHIKNDAYQKSRGIIAKEILKTATLKLTIAQIELQAVEPFTMIIVDWSNNNLHLFELVWDGSKKHFNKLKKQPKIWSSSTLYSADSKKMREKWFQTWLIKNDFTLKNILAFHHFQTNDKTQSILMKRSFIETVSITVVKKESNHIKMQYHDIIHATKNTHILT